MKKAADLLSKKYQLVVNRDSAKRYIEQAGRLFKQRDAPDLYVSLRYLQADVLFRTGNIDTASRVYFEQINKLKAAGKKREEAMLWFKFTTAISRPDLFPPAISSGDDCYFANYYAQRNANFRNGITIAREIHDKDLEAIFLANQISHLVLIRNYDEAQILLDDLIQIESEVKSVKAYEIYYLKAKMANLGKTKNFMFALLYIQSAIVNAKETHHEADMGGLYYELVFTYRMLKDGQHLLEATTNYIENRNRFRLPLDAGILINSLSEFIKFQKIKEAQELVNKFDTGNIYYSTDIVQLYAIFRGRGMLNTALQNYPAALSDYNRALQYSRRAQPAIRLALSAAIAETYKKWGKYDEARAYFEQQLRGNGMPYPADVENANRQLFMIDTLTGNFEGAVKHLLAADLIKDSIFTDGINKNASKLNIEYATAQRIKDIQALNNKIRLQKSDSAGRAKDIQLLKSKIDLEQSQAEARKKNILLLNAKLDLQNLATADKEKNIRLLHEEVKLQKADSINRIRNIEVLKGSDRLQKSELQKTVLIKNLTAAGALMLAVILGLGYKQYKTTRKSNDDAKKHNQVLSYLLQDKEVLMKEIHHRVKNNLQMILSLLESQSVFLKNDALMAIQSSQNRVQAMSLIHQKLYLTENVTSIAMSDYLRELITYLEESFDTGRLIYFRFELDPIDLDIAQAVPLGLIVNEAVTNSIKYAFPNGNRGEIFIGLKTDRKRQVELTISDNGIGLPKDVTDREVSSLGMKLIKGLAGNLDGDLVISSDGGTKISLFFAVSEPLHAVLN